MPVIESPEQYRARIKPVYVVNESNHTVVLKFNKAEFEFPPHSAERVPSEMAWLWFADPKAKELGARAWEREVRMLRERLGGVPMVQDPSSQDPAKEIRQPNAPPTAWELLEKNLLYCLEFGKGADLMKDLETERPIRFVARPLDEVLKGCGIAGVDGLAVAGIGTAELAEAMEASVRGRGDAGVRDAIQAVTDSSVTVIGAEATVEEFARRRKGG